MSKKNNNGGDNTVNEGFVPCKKGYKPKISEAKPVNPPKKK